MRKTILANTNNPLIQYLGSVLKTYPVLDYDWEYLVERNFKVFKKNVVEISTGVRAIPSVKVKVVNTWEQSDPKEFNVDLLYSNGKTRKNVSMYMVPEYLCMDLFGVDSEYYWRGLRIKLHRDAESQLKGKYLMSREYKDIDGYGQIDEAMDYADMNLGDSFPHWLFGTIFLDRRFWSELSFRINTLDGIHEKVGDWYRNWEKKNVK